MYLGTTQRRNKDGSVVRYYALAENVRHPEKGHVEAPAEEKDRAGAIAIEASFELGVGHVVEQLWAGRSPPA